MTTTKGTIGLGTKDAGLSETANAVYRVLNPQSRDPSNFLLRRKFARFVFQHYGNVVADRIGEPASLADQLLFGFSEKQRPFARRAHQDIEQFRIHAGFSFFRG